MVKVVVMVAVVMVIVGWCSLSAAPTQVDIRCTVNPPP